MSFTIKREKDEDLNPLQITDLLAGVQVSLLPETGALLHEFSIPQENRRIQVIDNYKNQADLQRNLSSSYKSAKLSPFVCRIAQGKYAFEKQSFEFQNKFNDGSAIHGILYNKPFRVLEKIISEEKASVLLGYEYRGDDPAYPFDYNIQIRYTLNKGGRLSLVSTLENKSPRRIPMADGWHPYFSLEGKVDDWLLSFHSTQNLVFDDKLIPTGQLRQVEKFYAPRLIGNEFFDHCFLLEEEPGVPAVELENPANGLHLRLFPDQHYPFLQIYTPPDRNSIAIENLSAAPDAFNNGLGLLIMEPGEIQSFHVLYQLELQ